MAISIYRHICPTNRFIHISTQPVLNRLSIPSGLVRYRTPHIRVTPPGWLFHPHNIPQDSHTHHLCNNKKSSIYRFIRRLTTIYRSIQVYPQFQPLYYYALKKYMRISISARSAKGKKAQVRRALLTTLLKLFRIDGVDGAKSTRVTLQP